MLTRDHSTSWVTWHGNIGKVIGVALVIPKRKVYRRHIMVTIIGIFRSEINEQVDVASLGRIKFITYICLHTVDGDKPDTRGDMLTGGTYSWSSCSRGRGRRSDDCWRGSRCRWSGC